MTTHADLRSFLTLSPDGVVVTDQDGLIIDVNDALLDLSGHRRETLLGRPVEMLVPGRLGRRHVRTREAYMGEATVRPMGVGRDLWLLTHDGRELAVDIALRPLHTVEGARVAAVIRDVSVARATQHRLVRTEAQLQAMNDELKRANTALAEAAEFQQDFISAASHELRTPLTAMTGFAEILVERWDELEQQALQDAAVAILRNAHRQLQLVDDLAHAAHLQAGRLEIQLADVKLDDVLREAVASVLGAEDFLVPDATGLTVVADEGRLVQIMINLLTNALRYGDAPRRLMVTDEGTHATICVADSGPGIPENFVPRAFDAFTQVSRGTRREAKGTGLGLYISRSLAVAMGGDLAYLGRVDGMTCFTLKVPKPPEPQAGQPPTGQ